MNRLQRGGHEPSRLSRNHRVKSLRPIVSARAAALFAIFAFLSSCSLVTVPVKTAGSVVETTVETAGEVIEAPFTRGRGKDETD